MQFNQRRKKEWKMKYMNHIIVNKNNILNFKTHTHTHTYYKLMVSKAFDGNKKSCNNHVYIEFVCYKGWGQPSNDHCHSVLFPIGQFKRRESKNKRLVF